jgi:hypothetical protein
MSMVPAAVEFCTTLNASTLTTAPWTTKSVS